ncbi:MAG: sigma-70 family RNA polymerase sigma factor [Oscillospiraceae bacterium]|nr:sigma-70 family RNA polymerase sigma factor [Oscillospiraceae bacterium]
MTNEELVALIQQGETERLPELWAQVEKFVAMMAGKRARALNGYGGVEAGDLINAGFLAMLEAAETFRPEEGNSFIGWLAYYLRSAFASAAGYRSRKRDPLNTALDLDSPLPGTDDLRIIDALTGEDEGAAQDFEDVERGIWVEQLRAALDKALSELPPEQRAAVEGHYLQERTFRELAQDAGCSIEMIRQREQKALRRMRHPRTRRALEQFVEASTPFYLHVGVSSFNSTGVSSVERIVEIRESIRERG